MAAPANTAPPSTTAVPARARQSATRALRRRLMLYALLFCGIYLGQCAAIAWETVRPKNAPLGTDPGREGMAFERVTFRSADGTALAGWFIPAPVKQPRGVIVLCHGVESDRRAMLWKARVLHKHGYATLLFDFRGRGESGPALCTIGYREVDDLLAAVKLAQSRPDCRGLPIGVFGESQGGAVALMGTARCTAVRAVAAESPFARLDHAVDHHFRGIFGACTPAVEYPVRWMGELLIRKRCCDVSPVSEVPRIAPRPILLIQDADDALCPPSETAALLAAAGPNASLWTVPGAIHVEAQTVAPDEFERRVTAFFDTALVGK